MVRNKRQYVGYSYKQEQQKIYDHLLYCVKTESPIQVLERFNHLFIKGTGYEDLQIRNTLEKIISANDAELNFSQFFNRCCHIMVKVIPITSVILI